jgi:hypothetical protein
LAEGLDRYREGVLTLHRGIEHLKECVIPENHAKQWMYDIFVRQIVPARFFRPVAMSYMMAAQQEDGSTLWSLMNAFTTHIKRLPPARAFQAHVELGKFFGLRAAQKELVYEGQV